MRLIISSLFRVFLIKNLLTKELRNFIKGARLIEFVKKIENQHFDISF